MGRPIKKKYINPADVQHQGIGGPAYKGDTGGEPVYVDTTGNVVIATITRGSGYLANATATISAPVLESGVTATVGTVYIFANGAVKAVQITNVGAGYLTNPTITFFGANTGTATATATITVGNVAPSIRANIWFPGTTTGDYNGDLIKQRGSHSFVCANATAQSTFKIQSNVGTNSSYSVLGPTAAGLMTIGASFVDGSKFAIKKITNRKVWSDDGHIYKWTFGTAANTNVTTGDITVQIDSD
jgi:hypothetical protein